MREKEEWVLSYIGKYGPVDVLNTDFVDAYAAEFRPRVATQLYGANKCPELGRLLSRMYSGNVLKRFATGIPGLCGMGFPRWVYVYNLPNPRNPGVFPK